jgi:membrane protein implicated in regulation of membrane protease activity
VTVDDSIGQPAQVVTAIPTDGYGVIRLSIGGHTLQYNAKADIAIEAGDDVRVTEVLSPSAVLVSPVWKPDNGTT